MGKDAGIRKMKLTFIGPDGRNKILEALDRAIDAATRSAFWTEYVEPHPIRAVFILSAIVMAILGILSLHSKAVVKMVNSDRKARAAAQTAAYYRNKLKPPEIKIMTRDRKQFKRCDPLRDRLISAESLEQVAWNWSYCRYVASLISADAEAAYKGCESSKRPIRKSVRKSFGSAMDAVPDKCRVWLKYVNKKGRVRDTYRFVYDPAEILDAVPGETRKAIRLLAFQDFRCAKCGKDPDDGVLFGLSPDGNAAWCDECAVGEQAARTIRETMARKAGAGGTDPAEDPFEE